MTIQRVNRQEARKLIHYDQGFGGLRRAGTYKIDGQMVKWMIKIHHVGVYSTHLLPDFDDPFRSAVGISSSPSSSKCCPGRCPTFSP